MHQNPAGAVPEMAAFAYQAQWAAVAALWVWVFCLAVF